MRGVKPLDVEIRRGSGHGGDLADIGIAWQIWWGMLRALSEPAVRPSLEEFRRLVERGNVVPVYGQLAADFETPLSAYLKVREGRYAFLLESAESTDASGRWSIVGTAPRRVFEARGRSVTIRRGSEEETSEAQGDLLAELERFMSRYRPVSHGNAPPFFGGAVGYLAYDAVRQFEPSTGAPRRTTSDCRRRFF